MAKKNQKLKPNLRDRFYLFLILALAFLVRLVGIRFGLPDLYHADEPIIVNHALAYGSGDLNPHFFKIPPLVSYVLFLVYGFYFILGRTIGWFANTNDFLELFLTNPSSFYLLARILFGVLLGTSSIYALYKLEERFFSVQKALISAFLF